MHHWKDEGVDWRGLSAAAQYLGDYCSRWGRFGGQTKEKYGTVRFYAQLGQLSLHSLFYPSYYCSQFPNWLWSLDLYYITPALNFLFGKLFYKWNVFIYNKAYQNALNKWPHLRSEILVDADYLELIEGASYIEETETEIIRNVIGTNGEIAGRWVSKK